MSYGRLGQFKLQELANTAWAFGVFDAHDAGSLLFDSPRFGDRCKELVDADVGVTNVDLAQLHQALHLAPSSLPTPS